MMTFPLKIRIEILVRLLLSESLEWEGSGVVPLHSFFPLFSGGLSDYSIVNFVFHGGIEMTAVMSCKNSTLSK